MPDGTTLPGQSLAVTLAQRMRRSRSIFRNSVSDDECEQWSEQNQYMCWNLAAADCLSLQDVLAKLEILCDRLRDKLNPNYAVPGATYMLAESARAGVAQLIEMHAAADPETAAPASG